MIDTIAISFEVACSSEHASAMWSSRIGRWWPADHTVSGSPAAVVLEGALGGREYERAADGVEFGRGRVTAWEPPDRLASTWHLKRVPSKATDVEIRFVAPTDERTPVVIEHRGWGRPGAAAGEWRTHNRAGWETLLPRFTDAIDQGDNRWQLGRRTTPGC
jgi:uncharacterized protein YndB with AHSA1/START domain